MIPSIEVRTSYKINYETDNGNNQFSYNCDEINHDYDQDDYNSDANLPYIYSVINPVINNVPAVGIFLEQNLFGVAIEVVDITFTFLENFEIVNVKIDNLGIHKNQITFENCTFSKNNGMMECLG